MVYKFIIYITYILLKDWIKKNPASSNVRTTKAHGIPGESIIVKREAIQGLNSREKEG